MKRAQKMLYSDCRIYKVKASKTLFGELYVETD